VKINLDEIATHRARLREEIMERECLLAALDVVEKYAASGHGPNSMRLGNLLSALLPSRPTAEVKELPMPAAPAAASPPSAPTALPPPPPVERYVHPELRAIVEHWNVNHTKIVEWAVAQMTEDYSLHDLSALLRREGYSLRNAEISVVLSRLKARGEIEEIKPGAGPLPAVFRPPQGVQPALSDEVPGVAAPDEHSSARSCITEPAVMTC
jgi:hypothetical protein